MLLGFDNGTFLCPTTYSTGYDSDTRSIIVALLNNDAHLDIAVANRRADSVDTVLRKAGETFASQVVSSSESGSRPHFLIIGDLNNNNSLDIIVANSDYDNVGIFLDLVLKHLVNKFLFPLGLILDCTV